MSNRDLFLWCLFLGFGGYLLFVLVKFTKFIFICVNNRVLMLIWGYIVILACLAIIFVALINDVQRSSPGKTIKTNHNPSSKPHKKHPLFYIYKINLFNFSRTSKHITFILLLRLHLIHVGKYHM